MRALAWAFYQKLQAPAALTSEGGNPNPDDCPMAHFRERVTGGHDIVTHAEVAKAVTVLTLRRAPGPDGFPVEVYRRPGWLSCAYARLICLVYATGTFQKVPRRLLLLPLVKSGRDPLLVDARRPIALPNAAVKTAEAVIHHGLLPIVEPQYKQERGREMRPTEIMGTVHRALV